MADVKWIKITTDMFDNRKIRHLRRLPDGDSVVLIWIMLLTMAGRCNAGGMIFLTENIPYTPKMLSDEMGFEESTVSMALQAMRELNMIVTDGELSIVGWEEYQNIEGMDKIREQNRIRKQRQREREKEKAVLCDSHGTVTQSHATEKEIEEEIEEEIEKNRIECVDYKSIVDLFNQLCPSFPTVKSISEARKKAIKARLNSYTIDDFRTMFIKAEASSFLKGANNRNWMASFDWLIKDSNMAKVLDGNYDDKINEKPVIETQKAQIVTKSSANFTEREFEGDALARELFVRA